MTHHPEWMIRGRLVAGGGESPKVMGILNTTPDSFSDGGLWSDLERARHRAGVMVEEGADIIDIGGESSRPGSDSVGLDEELRRVIPAVESISSSFDRPISVDTTKAEVARQALAAGACIVNDISALRGDPAMTDLVARTGAGVVLMHMQGVPRTMQHEPRYQDVVSEVHEFLAERVAWCEAHGIPRERISLDPGIGFGKTAQHNLALLQNLGRFANLRCVLLIGISRKGFLGSMTGKGVSERLGSTLASSLASCTEGARVVRVHDVGAMVDALKVWSVLKGWGGDR